MDSPRDKTKEKGLFCPYCTKEISPRTTECPWCGRKYESDTLQLLRSFIRRVTEESDSDRRQFSRTPQKFKIAYQSAQAFTNQYLSNLSPGGLFIKTEAPLSPGTHFNLKIFLPDREPELEIFCEVVWAVREKQMTPEGKTVCPGMGIKFLNLSSEGKKRIEKIMQAAQT